MSAKKIKDLVVSVGKYESGGQTKNRYLNVGLVLKGDDGGEFILINRIFNPAGVPNPDNKDTVLISAFDVKDRVTSDTHKGFDKQGDIPQSNPVETDEIPF